MSKENRWGDISKETQSESSNIAFWAFVLVIGAILMFLVLWAMFKIQAKLTSVRENFFSYVGWVILAFVIIGLLFVLFTFGLNRVSRKKYPKLHDETDESDT